MYVLEFLLRFVFSEDFSRSVLTPYRPRAKTLDRSWRLGDYYNNERWSLARGNVKMTAFRLSEHRLGRLLLEAFPVSTNSYEVI